MIFIPILKDFAKRALATIPELVSNAISKFIAPVRYNWRRKNYPFVFLYVLFWMGVVVVFPYDFIDTLFNLTLSLIMVPINGIIYILQIVIYSVLYVFSAVSEFLFQNFAGIVDKIFSPLQWILGSDYVSMKSIVGGGVSIIGMLNGFFGFHGIDSNSSYMGYAPFNAPPDIGDFTWRPVTIDVNNPEGNIINPEPYVKSQDGESNSQVDDPLLEFFEDTESWDPVSGRVDDNGGLLDSIQDFISDIFDDSDSYDYDSGDSGGYDVEDSNQNPVNDGSGGFDPDLGDSIMSDVIDQDDDGSWWDDIGDWASDTWDSITDSVSDAWDSVTDTVSDIADSVSDTISDIADTISDWFSGWW